jgi:hypothetical protein
MAHIGFDCSGCSDEKPGTGTTSSICSMIPGFLFSATDCTTVKSAPQAVCITHNRFSHHSLCARTLIGLIECSLRPLPDHDRVTLDRVRPPVPGGRSPPTDTESDVIFFLSARSRPASAEHTP